MAIPAIESLHDDDYRGFARFRLALRSKTVIVGPNNAGKSTLVDALRSCVLMLRVARSRRPNLLQEDSGTTFKAYRLETTRLGIEADNVRHEFQEAKETRLRLKFRNGASVTAVWPPGDDAAPFFYILADAHRQPSTTIEVAGSFPNIGVVPQLSPLDRQERVLDDRHVQRNLSTRLASGHFRNQLYLLQQNGLTAGDETLRDFQDFARPWLPEIELGVPRLQFSEGKTFVALSYDDGRQPKDVAWLGDGMQIWLQVLLHMYLYRGCGAVILDEPDVYLHADLQRRLMRLLDDHSSQVVLATHSPEVLAEASPRAITWVDRLHQKAVPAPDVGVLDELSQAIGSQFNLRLAKVLRARLALFVEGRDMQILSRVASAAGAKGIAEDTKIAIVPIEGRSNRSKLSSFRWIAENLLLGSIKGYVLLDRDYSPPMAVENMERELRDSGLLVHVWSRKELESYLLDATLIARVSGAPASIVSGWLDEIAEGLKRRVQSRMINSGHEEREARGANLATTSEEVLKYFEDKWSDQPGRIYMCPAKDVLAGLNDRLQSTGHKAVAPRSLAHAARREEIPDEMRKVLSTINGLLS